MMDLLDFISVLFALPVIVFAISPIILVVGFIYLAFRPSGETASTNKGRKVDAMPSYPLQKKANESGGLCKSCTTTDIVLKMPDNSSASNEKPKIDNSNSSTQIVRRTGIKIGDNKDFRAVMIPRLFNRFFCNIDRFRGLIEGKNNTFFNRCICEEGTFCVFFSHDLSKLKYLTLVDLYNHSDGIFCIDNTSGFDFSTEMKSDNLDIFGYVKHCKENGWLRSDFTFIAKIDNQWDYMKDVGRLYLVADKKLIRDKMLNGFLEKNATRLDYNIGILDCKNPLWNSSVDIDDTVLFSFLYPYNRFEVISAKYFNRFDRDVIY